MSIVITYRCDVCNQLKRESNNWFLVRSPNEAAGLGIFPFSHDARDDQGVIHCCGADCLARAVMRWAARQGAAVLAEGPGGEAA